MRSWVRALGAGLMLAILGAVPATAQTDDEDAQFAAQARAYLDAGFAAHEAHGYRTQRSIRDLVVPLTLNGPHLWPVNLRAGVNYRVYGACDDDCSDLDMEIYGRDGALVDRDIAIDDVPFVQITPTRSGTHYVRLWVYACDVEPCYSAARIVQGGTPVERLTLAPETETLEVPSEDGYTQVVLSELDVTGAQHEAAGYGRFGQDVIVAIPVEGEGHRESVRLAAGRAYLFQAACDQDCSDVDMEILDPSGAQVAVDEAIDDHPVVAVTPAAEGDYTVRVWLAQCSVEPCYIGLRGYVR